ncbi:MAG TPA: universal stress protein [Anaerolineae bacterium]|nr:universal stress protein [Anaerolineae bacterium]
MNTNTFFSKILVPLDGSALSERAIEPALAIGRRSYSEIILARAPIVDLALAAAPDRHSDQLHTESYNYLSEIQLSYASPYVKFHSQTIEGEPANAIIQTAVEERVDLIVMSTHGYSGITRLMLGSVTEKVLRSAPCPVLAIRSTQPIRRVLIPLDGSPLAERALPLGLELADRLGGEATLLRVVERAVPPNALELDWIENGLSRRLQNDLNDEASDYLHARLKDHTYTNCTLNSTIRIGSAADTILDFVDAHETDLVVMASHGRTGLSRIVYGSVTEKILRRAACSVMIVRSPAPELN